MLISLAYSGSPTSFSRYPNLKNVIHVGFHTLPGTIKYRQLLVYANKNFTTHSLPTDVPSSTPLYYAKKGESYKEYSLQDIENYADKFRSENGVNQDETIVVSGCPYCPGSFAAGSTFLRVCKIMISIGAYQSIAHGNYVILYGNEPLKGLVEKIQVQNPNYLVINQAFDKADLTSVSILFFITI